MILRLAEMYITLMPAVIAGIFNMVWCKVPLMDVWRKPLDAGKSLKDGKRIFGDNKTWKGFLGMIILGCIFTVLWGVVCGKQGFLHRHNYMYVNYENTLSYNMLMGSLFGLAYALFELPNSFVKRRFDIAPGKTTGGFKKAVHVFFDQADSVFGMVLVVCLVYRMSVGFYFVYVLVGAFTHIIINMLLYLCHLRRNMF